ncbi:MAG: hypothetical protein V2I33_17105 [Kangiellaceae bacterium]|nr:hypothetical protein [Kangiellaceae bacterium]
MYKKPDVPPVLGFVPEDLTNHEIDYLDEEYSDLELSDEYYSYDEDCSQSENECNQGNVDFDGELHAAEEKTENNPLPDLHADLLEFTIEYQVSRRGTQFLLDVLNKHGIDVPSSYHLFTKTTASLPCDVMEMGTGQFTYISVTENLKFVATNGLLKPSSSTALSCKINIDGVPLYRSSSSSLWPILIQFEGCEPLPIALFYGVSKPSVHQYLHQMVAELKQLQCVGVNFGGVVYQISRVIFICDAPARAYVQCVIGHTGKNGCPWCRCSATRDPDHRRMVFPVYAGEARQNAEYAASGENNQKELSPLTQITGLYSGFPVDYQHCVCLGVMRRLCHLYFSSVKSFKPAFKISNQQLLDLSDDISHHRNFTPTEFQRKPRRLDTDLAHYKATEFRSMLLYFGPFLFSKYLNKNFYNHFLLLHFAIYALLSRHCATWRHQAHTCLQKFVAESPRYFGTHYVSYNVHSLLHLAEFTELYGNLDNFSAFPFESFLGNLKRRVRSTNGIVQHVHKQFLTLRQLSKKKSRSCELNFSPQAPDNVALVNGRFVRVLSVGTDGVVSGIELMLRDDLYQYPYPSRVFGIGYYCDTRRKLQGIPSGKGFAFQSGNSLVVLPFTSNV